MLATSQSSSSQNGFMDSCLSRVSLFEADLNVSRPRRRILNRLDDLAWSCHFGLRFRGLCIRTAWSGTSRRRRYTRFAAGLHGRRQERRASENYGTQFFTSTKGIVKVFSKTVSPRGSMPRYGRFASTQTRTSAVGMRPRCSWKLQVRR